jgi:CRP/FNR family transcriptional regulator, cyclic AMP receptor protein
MYPLNLFRHETNTIDFAPGQTIFKIGDIRDQAYIVLEGNVEILVNDTVVELAGPGALVGEMALIDDQPRSATLVAKDAVRLIILDQRRFEFLIQQTPYFALHVMKVMAERLRRMGSKT